MKLSHIAFALATVIASPSLAHAQVTPQAVLTKLFRASTTGDGRPVFDYPATPDMIAHFSHEFVATWQQAMKHSSEYPVFDANPFTGRQDGGPPTLVSIDVKPAKDPYAVLVATVSDQNPPPFKVTYTFIREDDAWKIDEIEYQPTAGDPSPDRLKSYLSTVK